jgi:hypothetical protein
MMLYNECHIFPTCIHRKPNEQDPPTPLLPAEGKKFLESGLAMLQSDLLKKKRLALDPYNQENSPVNQAKKQKVLLTGDLLISRNVESVFQARIYSILSMFIKDEKLLTKHSAFSKLMTLFISKYFRHIPVEKNFLKLFYLLNLCPQVFLDYLKCLIEKEEAEGINLKPTPQTSVAIAVSNIKRFNTVICSIYDPEGKIFSKDLNQAIIDYKRLTHDNSRNYQIPSCRSNFTPFDSLSKEMDQKFIAINNLYIEDIFRKFENYLSGNTNHYNNQTQIENNFFDLNYEVIHSQVVDPSPVYSPQENETLLSEKDEEKDQQQCYPDMPNDQRTNYNETQLENNFFDLNYEVNSQVVDLSPVYNSPQENETLLSEKDEEKDQQQCYPDLPEAMLNEWCQSDNQSIMEINYQDLKASIKNKDNLKKLLFPFNPAYAYIIKNVFYGEPDANVWQNGANIERVFNNKKQMKTSDTNGTRLIVRIDEDSTPIYLQEFFMTLESIFPTYIKHRSILWSDHQTVQQDSHLDYIQLQNNWPPFQIPLIGIIALEDDVTITLEGNIIPIPKFDALIMKGNTYHNGGSWKQCSGARFHFFVDTSTITSIDNMPNAYDSDMNPIIEIDFENAQPVLHDEEKTRNHHLTQKINLLLTILSMTIPWNQYLLMSCPYYKNLMKKGEYRFLLGCYSRFLSGDKISTTEFQDSINSFSKEEIISSFVEYYLNGFQNFLKEKKRLSQEMMMEQIKMRPGVDMSRLIDGYNYPSLLHFIVRNDDQQDRSWKILIWMIPNKNEVHVYELYLFIIRRYKTNESNYFIYMKDFTKQNTWIEKNYSDQQKVKITKKTDEIIEILSNSELIESLFYRKVM